MNFKKIIFFSFIFLFTLLLSGCVKAKPADTPAENNSVVSVQQGENNAGQQPDAHIPPNDKINLSEKNFNYDVTDPQAEAKPSPDNPNVLQVGGLRVQPKAGNEQGTFSDLVTLQPAAQKTVTFPVETGADTLSISILGNYVFFNLAIIAPDKKVYVAQDSVADNNFYYEKLEFGEVRSLQYAFAYPMPGNWQLIFIAHDNIDAL